MRILLLCSILFSSVAFAQSSQTDRLAEAIEENNFKKAERAIRMGADVNGVDHSNTPSSSLFLRAAKLNRLKIVELLLNNKADVNQTRLVDSYSALILAAKYEHRAMAKLLIERGADVNQQSNAFRTALHVAALHDSISVVEELLKSEKLDANISNLGGLCALAIAARQNRGEIVVLLKEVSNTQCIKRAIDLAEYNNHENVLNVLRK